MKYKYSVDSNNQLVIKPSKTKMPLPVNGKFDIDENNQLIYWLNEPDAWRREYSLPNKIRFIGNWQLNSNYDLELVLDETQDQLKGNPLVLKGEIISTDRDTLVFEVISHRRKQGLSPKGTVPETSHIQLLKLSGFWQADEYNRLCFTVKKKASPDILTLKGIWQLNQNQQIVYTYEKTDLITKTKVSNTLTFEGFWQISETNKLTYILKHSPDSKFDFRAQIETPNIYPQEGAIKYRLGAGVRQAKKEKVISLYGAWKFNRKLGLIFRMDYGNGRICEIEFAADVSFDKRNEITFCLKNKIGEPLGLSVTFTHKFLKTLDAEAFLRLKDSYEESRIDAGMRIPF